MTTSHNVPHSLSRSYKRSTKSCTRVRAYRPYAINWGDLYLLYIPRNFCTWVHIGTPHRQKSHGFEGLAGITHLLSHTKMLCDCRCDTCFMGHFGHRIRWKHSFLRPTHVKVKVRWSKSGQIRLNREKQNFHSKICLYCPVLPQD